MTSQEKIIGDNIVADCALNFLTKHGEVENSSVIDSKEDASTASERSDFREDDSCMTNSCTTYQSSKLEGASDTDSVNESCNGFDKLDNVYPVYPDPLCSNKPSKSNENVKVICFQENSCQTLVSSSKFGFFLTSTCTKLISGFRKVTEKICTLPVVAKIKKIVTKVRPIISLYCTMFYFKYICPKTRRQLRYIFIKRFQGLDVKSDETEIESYRAMKHNYQSQGIWPFMWSINTLHNDEDTMVTVNGMKAYPMSSYSYLDFIRCKDVQDYAIKLAQKWGSGTHGPRMLGGNGDFLRDLEMQVAAFFSRDNAMVFSAGFMACMSTVCAVCKETDLVVGDSRLHTSVRTGLKLCGARTAFYRHNDYNHLEMILKKKRAKACDCWIVFESVYSMDGDISDLQKIHHLSQKYKCKIILDEAHGAGVLGKTGRGLEEHYNLPGVCTLIVGTFSKAFSAVGGYVTGNEDIIDFMDLHATANVFSAPMAAYCAGAAIRAIQLVDEQSWRVAKTQENSKYLRYCLSDGFGFWPPDYPSAHKYVIEGVDCTTVIPVIFPGDLSRVMRIASTILKRGYILAAVTFPACPAMKPRFRITATAAYTNKIIEEFVKTFVGVCVDEAPSDYTNLLQIL